MFLSFQDYFSLALSLVLSDHWFFFLFSILSYVVLIIVLLFIKYFECDKSTENNINIMNTHVPGYQEA